MLFSLKHHHEAHASAHCTEMIAFCIYKKKKKNELFPWRVALSSVRAVTTNKGNKKKPKTSTFVKFNPAVNYNKKFTGVTKVK